MADPIELWLNDRLVIKHFGIHPERGRRLRLHTMRSTAGVKWKQKRAKIKDGSWIPIGEPFIVRDEITVDAMIVLRPVQGKRGLWRVFVDKKWRAQALEWLETTCGELVATKTQRRYTKPQRVKVTHWGKMPMRIDNG
jgi:hypothetical protein